MAATRKSDSGAIIDRREKDPRDTRAAANLDRMLLPPFRTRKKLTIRHRHCPTQRLVLRGRFRARIVLEVNSPRLSNFDRFDNKYDASPISGVPAARRRADQVRGGSEAQRKLG